MIGLRHSLIGGCCLAGVAGVGLLWAQSSTPSSVPQKTQSALMLAKLASSQRIVAGLVSKDFPEIRQGAEELNRICEATEWEAEHDQIYAHHRTELKRQSHKLVQMANEQNLDGAAYTYMHTLTTCISCHEYCRDVLKIADEPTTIERVVPIPVTEETPMRLDDRPMRR